MQVGAGLSWERGLSIAPGAETMATSPPSPQSLTRLYRVYSAGTSLVVQWLRLHTSSAGGMWVQSLVGELRSHMPHSPPPKKNPLYIVFGRIHRSVTTRVSFLKEKSNHATPVNPPVLPIAIRIQPRLIGTSPAGLWLRLCTSTAGDTNSILGWGTKILYAEWSSQNKKPRLLGKALRSRPAVFIPFMDAKFPSSYLFLSATETHHALSCPEPLSSLFTVTAMLFPGQKHAWLFFFSWVLVERPFPKRLALSAPHPSHAASSSL